MSKLVIGSGGGGSSARPAVEDPNTLRSKSFANTVDLLGEGEWKEFENGVIDYSRMYLNEVPVAAEDGTQNFTGLLVAARNGTLSQSAIPMTQIVSITEPVGVELTVGNPIEKLIVADSADILRVTVATPKLAKYDPATGDLHGNSVEYKIEYNSADNLTFRQAPGIGTNIFRETTLPASTAYTGYTFYWFRIDSFPSIYKTTGIETYGGTKEFPYTIKVEKSINGGAYTLIENTRLLAAATTAYQVNNLAITDTVKLKVTFTSDPGSGFYTILKTKGGARVRPEVYANRTDFTSNIILTGKTTSNYEHQNQFRPNGVSPFTIRVSRISPDSTTEQDMSKLVFSSVSAVLEEKFRYPGSVVVGSQVDAQQFDSIPSRAFKCKMLKVKIPNNYNPDTRVYTGVWNGGFATAKQWTDNPAWCFYDLITAKRYGLGERIPESYIDKFALYAISKYCDELVPNGKGGFGPRFTCNLYLQTQQEAYKVVSDMASIFRAITYWGLGTIVPVQDGPREPKYAFNNTNVIDGNFNYQSSSAGTRFNAVNVTWNNPKDFYRQAIEYVEDTDAIVNLGYINATSTVAFGCTDQAMARRVGKWLLYSNSHDTDAVTFSVGRDGAIPRPGDVIQIFDTLRASERRGGRIVSATASVVTIDNALTFLPGVTYTISSIDTAGKLQEGVFTWNGTTSTITLSTPFPAVPTKDSIFIITDNNIPEALFNVLSVVEKDDGGYDISAITYNPQKFDYVEKDIPIQDLGEDINLRAPITSATYQEVLYRDGNAVKSKLSISWERPKYSSSFSIVYTRPDGVVLKDTTTSVSLDILDTFPGVWNVSVFSINALGQWSTPYKLSINLHGKTAPPSDIVNFAVRADQGKARLTWDTVPDLDVQVGGFIVIAHSPKTVGATWSDGVVIDKVPGSLTSTQVSLLGGTYMAKALDSSGVYSKNAAYSLSDYALVQKQNIVVTLQQETAFAGVKTGMYVIGNELTLSSVNLIDDAPLIDTVQVWDTLDGGVIQHGEYVFDNIVDLGNTYLVSVSAIIGAYSVDLQDFIDQRLADIDDWILFDSANLNTAQVKLYISTTPDNPSGTPTWSPWNEFISADYSARGMKFKILVDSPSEYQTIFIQQLSVIVDAADRVLGEENIACPPAGVAITFTPPFMDTPAIAINIDGMVQGDYYEISSKSASGFTLKCRNAAGTYVSRQVDWIAKGYGIKTN